MRLTKATRVALAGAACVAALAGARAVEPADPLAQGFADPPHAARPWVWWHWMNGNISADGAKRDLQWMHRVGIGGAQLFEGGLGAPQVVPQRVVFMSGPWKDALRASASEATRLGLDLGIATSPGWSATGGPWVAPEDAMKKLVWSQVRIRGGGAGPPLRLQQPSNVAGPYQDVPLAAVEPGGADGPRLFRDARILAFPAPHDDALLNPRISSSDAAFDTTTLSDGRWAAQQPLKGGPDGSAWLLYDYGRPVTIRSVAVGLPEPTGFGAPKPSIAVLEASDDGRHFRDITTLLPGGSAIRTASFASVSARWFRLRLMRATLPGFMDRLTFAPGAIRPSFGPPAVPAFPVSEVTLAGVPRIDHAPEKAGFATLPDYYAVPTPAATGIDPAGVLDLTDRMRPDGTLDWQPPAGDWIILRLGWSPTGHRNGPAPAEATGLEVDKLDPARVSAYMTRYFSMYRAALGSDDLSSLRGLLSDSIEAGPQNWTEQLPAAFRSRRGYDPTPWLPALTGMIVGDAARTDRFLWDWRKTIAELYADAHYAGIAAAARRQGLVYYAEALEDHRPQLGDDMAMRAVADVPMAAMWTLDPGATPNPTYVADIKGAASIADLYGKQLVAAETLTAFGHPYAYAPADLKRTVDLAFALGINRIMIHTSPHQPLPDAAPGVAMAPFLGQYFSRNETWAELARGWTDYIARSSFLLQKGRKVADIAYFYGEEAPLTALYGDHLPEGIPAGYDYDFVNADALRNRLQVVDGTLTASNGIHYRLLVLRGSSRWMTLATLRRLHALLEAGATIAGDRPVGSPSLADDDSEVAGEIAALWGESGAPVAVRHIGQGRLYPLAEQQNALADLRLDRDWQWISSANEPDLAVIHRAVPGADIYFLSNRQSRPVSGQLSVRVDGRVPELWNAEDGRRTPVSYSIVNGRTVMPLTLAADEATFVILRGMAKGSCRTMPAFQERKLARVDGDWTLTFQPARGAPVGARAASLGSWTESPDARIRYFSGVGTYRIEWTMPPTIWRRAAKRTLMLDLGRVGELARVSLNGKLAGIAWKAPYRVDVSTLLRPSKNMLTVEVANLWVNRLIGDAQPSALPVAHVTGSTYASNAPLRKSGLMGPVELIATSSLSDTTLARR